jgi:UDP-N-acetylmuramoylalanine--D-glutamate ligase
MKIAILGYGIEGESVYKYFSRLHPDAEFTVYDNNSQTKRPLPDGVKFVGGVSDFKGVDADIAIKTPAIAPWNVQVTGETTSVTREFLKKCPAPVIGVTGSKGKGTTSSLIEAILRASGVKTWLVGNIGKPALDILSEVSPDDVVVYELSSFQLWDSDVSPHVAVVLGIEPEHLDVHRDIDDYVGAKANITKYQSAEDLLVYKSGNEYVGQIVAESHAEKQTYPNDESAHVKDSGFYYGEQFLCSVEELKIPGVHNQENACAAIDAAWNWVQDGAVIARGLADFEGLPHRLKYVRTVGDVAYYDDSIATTPGSVVAALNAFDAPKVVIIGGSSKGANYVELASALAAKKDSVRTAIIIGVEAPKIEQALKDVGFADFVNLGSEVSMQEIVSVAQGNANSGDIVILSPACASFDMFKDYQDRGNQFIAAVQNL